MQDAFGMAGKQATYNLRPMSNHGRNSKQLSLFWKTKKLNQNS
jgi:hypothetical protein